VGDPADIDPLVIRLDEFQGPLDLLLHLIRRQDIDIFDIPIARITAQFLEVIGELERLELERAGEFIEMAATLVRIKAQLLFPRREEELEAEDPRGDLVRRLLEYEHFTEIARTLERAERQRIRRFSKGFVQARPRPPVAESALETEWSEVWGALLTLAERSARPEPGYRVAGRAVEMEAMIERIVAVLEERARVEFGFIISPWGTRMHAVVSLLACLELAKRSSLRLRQTAPFAPLWVYRRNEGADAA